MTLMHVFAVVHLSESYPTVYTFDSVDALQAHARDQSDGSWRLIAAHAEDGVHSVRVGDLSLRRTLLRSTAQSVDDIFARVDRAAVPETLALTDAQIRQYRTSQVAALLDLVHDGTARGYITMLWLSEIERCDAALAGDLLARNKLAQTLSDDFDGSNLAAEHEIIYAAKLAAFVGRES